MIYGGGGSLGSAIAKVLVRPRVNVFLAPANGCRLPRDLRPGAGEVSRPPGRISDFLGPYRLALGAAGHLLQPFAPQ
jgi:hypothetical protein